MEPCHSEHPSNRKTPWASLRSEKNQASLSASLGTREDETRHGRRALTPGPARVRMHAACEPHRHSPRDDAPFPLPVSQGKTSCPTSNDDCADNRPRHATGDRRRRWATRALNWPQFALIRQNSASSANSERQCAPKRISTVHSGHADGCDRSLDGDR